MKVKDLKILPSKELQKLRDVSEMDVADYLKFIDEKKKKGIKINKPYQELYDNIKANWAQIQAIPVKPQVQQSAIDPVKLSLEPIPIDELKIHFPSDSNIVDRLKSGGIVNLGLLYETPIDKIGRLPYIGATTLSKILSMKYDVTQNPNDYIDAWHDSLTIHELPSNYNRSFGLVQNLRNAILEYAKALLQNLHNKRYVHTTQQYNTYSLLASILLQYYKDKKNLDQIAQQEGCTHQNVEIIKGKFISQMVSGAILDMGYKINQSLLDLLQSLKDECLFDPIHKFEVYSGTSDTSFFNELGFDTLEIKDVTLLIPKDTKKTYRTVWSVINKTLLENPLPTDVDVIYQLVINSKELANVEYDTLFVEKVLKNDSIVEDKGNHSIQIKNEYLSHSDQRFARIIYEAGKKITTSEAKEIYEIIYKAVPTKGPANGKYGICLENKKYWYYGQPRTPIQQKISDYAENKEVFYYQDLEQELLRENYTIPQAIRVYITNVCVADNKDKNHFCHKDYVDNYPAFSWRNPNKYGWGNWIFNEIKNILDDKGSLPLQEMIDELEERSHATDYSNVRQRIQYNNMADYCGEDKPFIIEEENVVINQPVYDETDFETIGLRGEKYAYFKQIRSLVANEVKKAEDGRMKLMDIIQLVNETVVDDEPLHRNVIIRAIKDEQHRFSPIDVELVNEKGVLYAQWTKQDIVPEPIYTLSLGDDVADEEVVIESEQIDTRPNIKYRQLINWEELNSALKRELSFYGRWMQYENYELNDAVDLFVSFISHSKNYELKTQLPLDLYEYLFASTDAHDRYRYLKDIILDFEAILGELYFRRYGEEPHTKGLTERAAYFEGLPDMLMYSREDKGFSRIASNLCYHRNKVAHGGYLELSSLETARLIVEYVALFIYIVAKYYNKL
jgi:hypothetical protein